MMMEMERPRSSSKKKSSNQAQASMALERANKQNQLSLSVEPLLLNEPYKPTVVERQCERARHHKALFLFFRILIVLLCLGVIGQLVSTFLVPLLASLQAQWLSGAKEVTKVGHLFSNEMPEIVEQFKTFERNFQKVWANEKERFERFKVFEQNLYKIKKLKRKNSRKNVRYGINGLADISDEQFKQMLLPMDYFKKRRQNATFIREMNPILRKAYIASSSNELADQYPSHFDWRDRGVVTPVKAQGMCGSCWAFAAVATTESANAVAHGVLKSLSEQELLDCNLENNACNGGNEDKAFKFIHDTGLVPESHYPYVAHRQNVCRVDERRDNFTKIDLAVFINPDEQSMLDWLINFGPVNVGIAVPPDMKPYTGGIYHPSDYDCKFRVLGLHALLAVGYGITDEGEKYWIVKNSWGNTWGQEHGYVNFIRGINACGIEDEPIGLLA